MKLFLCKSFSYLNFLYIYIYITKSLTTLIAFHFSLIFLAKAWIHLFSHYPSLNDGVISKQATHFIFWYGNRSWRKSRKILHSNQLNYENEINIAVLSISDGEIVCVCLSVCLTVCKMIKRSQYGTLNRKLLLNG